MDPPAGKEAPSTPSAPSTPGSTRVANRPMWFVGHWWGESVLDFTKRIMKHAGSSEESYWVCPLCTTLHECSGLAVTDAVEKAGVVGLHQLTTLKVFLSGCSGFKAINELERGLSAFQALTMLELNFSHCWEIE